MATNKQRREAARRKLESQLVVRQERARRRRRGNVIASAVGAVVIVAIVVTFALINNSHSKSTASKASTTPAATASTTAATTTPAAAAAKPAAHPYPCAFTKSGIAARKVIIPTVKTPPRTGVVNLTVVTSRGAMKFQLTRSTGPCAVESVVSLLQQKYYDKTPCHRLVNSGIYVLQCGDPTGKGTGGPGYTVNDEYTGKETYGAGVIAMANTGEANSTGGQFFIMYKDSTAGLAKTYTVIGKVTAGLSIVDQVAAGGLAANKVAPKLPISILSMRVV